MHYENSPFDMEDTCGLILGKLDIKSLYQFSILNKFIFDISNKIIKNKKNEDWIIFFSSFGSFKGSSVVITQSPFEINATYDKIFGKLLRKPKTSVVIDECITQNILIIKKKIFFHICVDKNPMYMAEKIMEYLYEIDNLTAKSIEEFKAHWIVSYEFNFVPKPKSRYDISNGIINLNKKYVYDPKGAYLIMHQDKKIYITEDRENTVRFYDDLNLIGRCVIHKNLFVAPNVKFLSILLQVAYVVSKKYLV